MTTSAQQRIRRPAPTSLAWALCILSAILAAASVALASFNGENPVELVANHHAIGVLNALILPLVGALIVVGDRRHLLAWLLIMDGVFLAVYNLSEQYAPLALGLTSRRLSLPDGELASWLTSWTNVPGIVIAAVFLILLFPDGRPPSRRWWPLGLAGAVILVVPTAVLAVGYWPLRGPSLLTALLGAVYAGLVLALGQLFGRISSETPSWAVAGATPAVAALFQPARRRIQSGVDRRFNRRKYNAAKTIEAFSIRLRDQVDLGTLSAELLAVVDQTFQPTTASLWLRPSGRPSQRTGT